MYALKKPVDPPLEAPPPAAMEAVDILRLAEPGAGAAWEGESASPRITPPQIQGAGVRWIRDNAMSMLLWAVSLGLLFGFWYLGTKYRWDFYIRFNNIPTPAEVFAKIAEVNRSEKFIVNIGISVRRILAGFGIATLIAVPMGLAIGRYRVMRDLLLPMCEVLRPIPAIAWVPMSIMLWPTNEVSIVFITFLGSFFPILLNTIHGVTALDSVLTRAGRCLGANGLQMFWNVILPGAMPQIFTGLAVGMGVAWVSLIAAEMISGQFGIGYFTWEAYSLIAYSEIALGMITIGILGLVCSGVIRLVGHLAMPWLSFSNPDKR